MARWYRVFAGSGQCPPEEMLPGATFGREGEQWFWAEMPDVRIDRFLAGEEGLRAELNSWAAVAEATLDEPAALMERIIQSEQVFTILAETEAAEPLAESLARALAARTQGCYQIDEGGWHEGDGSLIAGEEADGER